MLEMNNFVQDVDKKWQSQNYELSLFPDLAYESLCNLESFPAPPLELFLNGLEEGIKIPFQTYPDAIFSDFPFTLARTPKVHLDMYYWFHTDTSVHNHHFSGAFKVIQGKSHQLSYEFKVSNKVDEHLFEGQTIKKSDLILSVGDVHRIHPQDEFIHQVIHLEKPTVTLCLRTDNLPGMNLWSFILPKYKILYKDFDENQKKWYQSLKNIYRYYPEAIPQKIDQMPLTAGDILRIIIQANSGDKPLEPIHQLILTSLQEKGIGLGFFEMLQSQHKMNQKLKMFGAIS